MSNSNSYPITQSQLEVWLLSRVSDEANCAFNEIASLEFKGDIRESNLKSAIDQVVKRNESLRTTFDRQGANALVQSNLNYEYAVHDWTNCNDSAIESNRKQLLRDEGNTPFHLESGPLLRIHLQKLPQSKCILTFTAHHIILDGWSLWVFCRDLGHCYDQLNGVDVTLPAANSYRQYAELMVNYHNSEEGTADGEFWKRQFSDSIPTLDLPTDRARAKLKTFRADRVDRVMDKELVAKLRAIGAKNQSSLFHVMLTGFNAYLSRITQQDDFSIGIPTAGQGALERHDLIGHCVNALPVRFQVDMESSLLSQLRSTRTKIIDALEHQKYTFGTMLRELAPQRDPSRPPIFSIMFNIDPEVKTDELGFAGLEVNLNVEPRTFENMEWFLNGVIRTDGSVEFQCQFNADLFDQETIANHLESYEAFLHSFVRDPNQKSAGLSLLSIDQKQKMIVDWNASQLDYPIDSGVHHEISKQAKRTPDRIAVEFGEASLTYTELEKRSNQVARFLKTEGVKPRALVGISMSRSESMLVTLLGIWKAGAGYVPLDPNYPIDRLQYMCEHSKLSLVITESQLAKKSNRFDKPVLFIDECAKQIQLQSTRPVESEFAANDTAYVIYTSGSTGKPKGVNVPHGPVVNFLFSMQQTPGFRESDRIMAVTTLSFDIAVLELYLPLVSGGQVIIADAETASDGFKLSQAIVENKISFLQATPATWRMLIEAGWHGDAGLKVLCGGEPMPRELVAPLLDRCSELWNMYGPTETTVWSTAFQITSADDPIYIGKPIGNTQIYLLDAKMQPVPQGTAGELFIGGAGVTHGYLHRNDLTEERFVDNPYFNPFSNFVSQRLYRTGDLARYMANGNIEFLRRNDKQVKVRGYRIELGEIEQAILSNETVAQTAVIVREDVSGDVRLVAYLTVKPDCELSINELRNQLRDRLPHYMVPHHFLELEEFPKTNNGKVDHTALPAPMQEQASLDEGFALPQSDSEKLIASVWGELLQIDAISIDDNFFDIGGHSLLVMKSIARIDEMTGIRLSPQDFLMETLEQLASRIEPRESIDSELQETLEEANQTKAEFDANLNSSPVANDPVKDHAQVEIEGSAMADSTSANKAANNKAATNIAATNKFAAIRSWWTSSKQQADS